MAPSVTKGDWRDRGLSPAWLTDSCVCAESLQSCPTLCNPMDHSPLPLTPGSFVHGIPGKNSGVGCMPTSRGSPLSRDWTHISYVSCIVSRVLYHCCHLGSPVDPYSNSTGRSQIFVRKPGLGHIWEAGGSSWVHERAGAHVDVNSKKKGKKNLWWPSLHSSWPGDWWATFKIHMWHSYVTFLPPESVHLKVHRQRF